MHFQVLPSPMEAPKNILVTCEKAPPSLLSVRPVYSNISNVFEINFQLSCKYLYLAMCGVFIPVVCSVVYRSII